MQIEQLVHRFSELRVFLVTAGEPVLKGAILLFQSAHSHGQIPDGFRQAVDVDAELPGDIGWTFLAHAPEKLSDSIDGKLPFLCRRRGTGCSVTPTFLFLRVHFPPQAAGRFVVRGVLVVADDINDREFTY